MHEQNSELYTYLTQILSNSIDKCIISHPKSKSEPYKKIAIHKKNTYFQFEKYTDKQVFHENINESDLLQKCMELIDGHYLQVNAWTADTEFALLISKKGKCALRKIQQKTQQSNDTACTTGACNVNTHNRKKNYILEEGTIIPPLVDMGIFTQEGKVVRSMYDKYRQIPMVLVSGTNCNNNSPCFSIGFWSLVPVTL